MGAFNRCRLWLHRAAGLSDCGAKSTLQRPPCRGYTFKGLIAGVQALGSSSLQRRARGRSIVLSLQVQSPWYLLQGQRLPAPAGLQMAHKCACTLPSIYTPCKPCADVPPYPQSCRVPMAGQAVAPTPTGDAEEQGCFNSRLESEAPISADSIQLDGTRIHCSSAQFSSAQSKSNSIAI